MVGNAEARNSLAFPRQMAISEDGKTLYVAALGSSKIGVFDTASLESDSFIPSENNCKLVTHAQNDATARISLVEQNQGKAITYTTATALC